MHANFASILGSILKRFGVHSGSENEAKMATKFNVFWHWFLIPFFDVSGWCLLVFFKIFASWYDDIFSRKTLCFSVFLCSCLLHDQLKERSQTLQKPNQK